MIVEINAGEKLFAVKIQPLEKNVEYDGTVYSYQIHQTDNHSVILRLDNQTWVIDGIENNGSIIKFCIEGNWYEIPYFDEKAQILNQLGIKTAASGSETKIISPMPGKILSIKINVGDTIKSGDPVVILEAMKMENEIKSTISGKVKKINVAVGQSVEKNVTLLEIE